MKLNPIIFLYFLSLCSCSSFDKNRSIASDKQVPLEKIGKRYIFEKYKTAYDGLTYYYFPSKSESDPLILTIQGSGCDSIYTKDDKGNVFGGLHTITAAAVEFRAAVLAVEKPFVQTFHESVSPGNAKACSSEFRENFNRNNWVNALTKTVAEAISYQGLNPSRIIVVGHSEGASIAAAVAAALPKVSHVIYASGGGGNPLFEAFLRRKNRAQGNPQVEDDYIKEAIRDWRQMMAHPENTQKLFSGHPSQYWLAQVKSNSAEDLKRSDAKVYVIQGTKDQDASVEASDLLVSELVVAGKELEYKRIIGADHSYEINGESRMSKVIAEALEWALRF